MTVPRFLFLVFTLAFTLPAAAQPLEWTSHGTVASGNQFDAVRGPDGIVHLIGSRYYQLDRDGNVLVDEDVGDGHQGDLDFPPAIAVEGNGTVHVVTRHDGDFDNGMDIRYRRRSGGSWDRDYFVGEREKRNYVVGVAVVAGVVYVNTTAGGSDVWGDVRLWEAGASSATALGDLSGIWRADTGARLRSSSTRLFLATGKCDPGGTAYLLHATPGGDVVGTLAANTSTHTSGSDRRGCVDLNVDGDGHAHLTYGAQHTVWYNRYDDNGQRVHGSDLELGDGLGDWHLSTGMSAVAASEDGDIVVAVMLRSDGSQTAADSDLLWTYSLDGGATWSEPEDMGVNVSGGEGRLLPRIVAVGTDFLLFHEGGGGITLHTMHVELDADGDGFPSDEDCDDHDPHTYPGGIEICDDGIDNDCDGATDGADTDCGGTGDDDDVADDDDTGGPDDDDFEQPVDDDDTDGGGGCDCRVDGTGSSAALGVVAVMLMGWLGRRRR